MAINSERGSYTGSYGRDFETSSADGVELEGLVAINFGTGVLYRVLRERF